MQLLDYFVDTPSNRSKFKEKLLKQSKSNKEIENKNSLFQ